VPDRPGADDTAPHEGHAPEMQIPARRTITSHVAGLGLPVVVAAGFAVGSALLADVHAVGPVGFLLLAVGAAGLLVRRAHPIASLTVTLLAAFAYDVLDFPAGLCTISVGVAIFAVVDAGHPRAGLAAVLAVVGGFFVLGVGLGRGHIGDVVTALWFAGWLVASFVLGDTTREHRAYLHAVEERARVAERGREEEARRRAREERIRIAREIHDVLANRISMISVQSAVGAHLIERDPEQGRRALEAVNTASREALRELRATLGLLREVDGPEPRVPVPGLDQIATVIQGATGAGLDVDLRISGEQRSLPTPVDLAAYRIVQESLTNVVRHSGAERASVGIAYRAGDIVIDVADDGHGRPAGQDLVGGNGLLGMRERVSALGGDLDVGPRSDGGFRVRARLPLEPAL
jgi:signal transduction histidine kinase